ncbi:unnamed protein product [Blepharisma stoltei]|uniref:Calponin-homology (CH) domain-containing protein n=1 Tax=Blepharisma stoltei TaxID=1481888 RepID=A0AAU9JUU3_9CILI|nr:unnamed protein product [Blepharisma stoltei]
MNEGSKTPSRYDTLMLIDWVNSLDISSCTLVDALEDLKSGAVVGDIIAWMKNIPCIRGIERVLVSQNEAINNWVIVLKELEGILPRSFQEIDPQDLYEDDVALMHFLRFLSNLDNKEEEKIQKDMPMAQNFRPETPASTIHVRNDSAVTNRYQESPRNSEATTPSRVSSVPAKNNEKTPQKNMGKPPIPPSVNTPIRKSTGNLQVKIEDNSDNEKHVEKAAKSEEEIENPQEPVPRQHINSYFSKKKEDSHISDTPLKPPEQSICDAQPVPEIVQEAVIEWLESLQLVRKGSLNYQLLPNVCRTGVLFCDVINRLEGRKEAIKGVERAPKNRTQALTNVNKVLEFLRTHPKMNSRYLWSGKNILEGDEYIIWGLLEDIKTYYTIAPRVNNNNKSRNEVKSRTSPNTSLVISPPFTAQQSTILSIPQSSPQNRNTSAPHKTQISSQSPQELAIPKSFLQEKSKNLRSYAASARSRTPGSRSTPTSHTPRTNSPRSMRPPSAYSSKKNSFSAQHFIPEEAKKQIRLWLFALDIDYDEIYDNKYSDPLRNGLLLCELMKVLENVQIKINPNPRNEKAIKENFEKALTVMQEKRTEIPEFIYSDCEILLKNVDAIWSLLFSLMSAYPQAVSVAYQPCSLPYGALGVKKLETAIVNWLNSLSIFNPENQPNSFFEILYDLKTGVLLCVLISKLCGWKIQNVIKNPKTEQTCLNNIRKALEVLRKMPKMSQKFTWSEKEILKGNCSVILGLLEDIYRCYDGLPTRKAGSEYHADGPYLGKEQLYATNESKIPKDLQHIRTPSWKAKQEDSFTGTFGSNDTPREQNPKKRVSYSEKNLSPSHHIIESH